mgnify:CR=1 FL=1|jgi:3-hexulose-6-phosphate synthase
MRLQIAMDAVLGYRAIEIVETIHDVIDIVEIGTPLILREGLSTVSAIKNKYPALTVLADTKIVDGGELECRDACEAGADIITFLALANLATARAVIDTAHRYSKKAMADLICVQDIKGRSIELKELGVDYICVHTAVDIQTLGRTPLEDLKQLVTAVPSSFTAAAGGINMENLASFTELNPEIIIAGSSLMNSENIRNAVIEMQHAIKK